MFEFESIEFTTRKVMTNEKSRLIHELCLFLGIDRKDFRLQRGNVTLYGLTSNNVWLPLTSHIGDFNEKLKNTSYKSFKLKTKLTIKEK